MGLEHGPVLDAVPGAQHYIAVPLAREELHVAVHLFRVRVRLTREQLYIAAHLGSGVAVSLGTTA